VSNARFAPWRQSSSLVTPCNGSDVYVCDGVLDLLDAIAVLRTISQLGGTPSPTAPCTADANKSGAVTAADALWIMRTLAGLDPH
jgi:hypothetical protein